MSTPENPVTGEAPEEQPPAAARPDRRWKVAIAIPLVALLFMGMLAVIYYHSVWRVYRAGNPPTALFVVQGDEDYAGAVVTLEEPSQPPKRGTLTAENNYVQRFIVRSGIYEVAIYLPDDSGDGTGGMRLLGRDRFSISDHAYRLLTLTDPGNATTQPQAGAN